MSLKKLINTIHKVINTIQGSNERLGYHVTDATFFDTTIHEGQRFNKQSVLNKRMHFKPTETFQYIFFTTWYPPVTKKGFIKGEALGQTSVQTKYLRKTLPHYGERPFAKLNEQPTFRSVISRKDTSLPPMKQNKYTNLALQKSDHPAVPNVKEILTRKWYRIH